MDAKSRKLGLLTLGIAVLHVCCGQILRDRSVNCNSNSMEVSLEFAQPFTGIVYANKFYQTQECRWEGNGSRRLVSPIPLNTNPTTQPHCGVQLKESTGEFTVTLIISPMKGLLVEGMMGLTVRCLYNIGDVTLTLPAGPNGAGIFISPQTQAGIVTGSGGSPFLQMAIRDGHGINSEIVQAASVGQRITLDVIMQDTTIYDFYVHDCYAHDGTNTPEASISIIDANGCAVRLSRAVDVPVFTTPPVSNGAKHVYVHMYGFQFTTSQLVYFECQVRPCLQSCNRPQCSTNNSRRKREDNTLTMVEDYVPRLSASPDETLEEEGRNLQEINADNPPENYNLTAIIRIEPQPLVNVIPAARDAPLDVAGIGRSGGELCIHTHVAVAILVIFVVVCVVSLIIAIFVCHRAHLETKDPQSSAAYYSPSSTPSQPLTTPSPISSQFRHQRESLRARL